MKLRLKESFDPRGYTNAIRAISAGIETDEDKEALQKYLQDIIGYCRSIADDYGILVESDSDDFHKLNDKSFDLYNKVRAALPDEELKNALDELLNTTSLRDELITKVNPDWRKSTIKQDDTYPKDSDTIDVENSTNEEIQNWLDRNNDKSEHSDDFNKVWLDIYKELQRRKDIKDSEATQPEDIAKKEEQNILVTPRFKIGKRIKEEK